MESPFFIIGAERSGTTLLMMMFNSHSELAIPYESYFITEIYDSLANPDDLGPLEERQELLDRILDHPWVKRWHPELPKQDFHLQECQSYADLVSSVFSQFANLQGKPHWGDKTPGYTSRIDVLNRLFPRSRFIHIIRDGRDVASSLRKLWYRGQFIPGLEYWAEVVSLARKMGSMLPEERYTEIRFEDLVSSPEAELRHLCHFLGLPFEAQMLEYYKYSASVVGHRIEKHHKNLLRRPTTDQCFKWKQNLGRGEQALADFLIGKQLSAFNYDESEVHFPFLTPYRYLYHLREGLLWRLDRFRRNSAQGRE